jgi:hypothetical protein
MVRLIGIVGAAGAGKSSVATYLQEYCGAKRIRLADGLKRMLRCLGLTHEQVDGSEKLQPVALLCGKTPRKAMQTLGTGWGREMIGNDLWVNIAVMSVTREWMNNPDQLIIIDDVRHANEVAAIRELGGEIWTVRNPRVEPDLSPLARFARLPIIRWITGEKVVHMSEIEWAAIKADRVIYNVGDLPALYAAAARALGRSQAHERNYGSGT